MSEQIIWQEKYLNKIVTIDCFEGMKELPDSCVDLIFADPPYNTKKDYGKYKDNLPLKEYYNWCEKWLAECIRILKPNSCIFIMNYPEHLAYFKVFLDKYLNYINWIIWVRNDNQPYQKNRKFKKNHQDVLFYTKGDNYYFDWRSISRIPIWSNDKRVKCLAGQTDTWLDITYVKGNSKEKTDTDNQLPIKLLERIILATTKESMIVLDPFTGSATTFVVCLHAGRNFIGMEISPEYCEIANKRIWYERQQLNLKL